MARKLTMRQHKFAVEYVANGGNGTQAAKAAGYGEAGAHVLASQTLRNPKVQQAIAQAEARIIRRIKVTPEKVMGDLEEARDDGRPGGVPRSARPSCRESRSACLSTGL